MTTPEKNPDATAARAVPCAICQRPQKPEYRPFCSRRCADIDLSRWLHGVYTIPVVSADDDEDGELAPVGDGDGSPSSSG